MTGEERDVTGVKDAKELRTLRDSLTDMAEDFHELVGSFKTHVETEEKWQGRIEERLLDEHDKMYEVAREAAGEAIRTHEEKTKPQIDKALQHIDAETGQILDRRAVMRAKDKSFRTAVIILVVLVIGVAAVLEFIDKEEIAGAAFAVIAVATPFTLWYLNRPTK